MRYRSWEALLFEVHQARQAGIFVRTTRMARGMTQRQLAERAGVSERSILSLEMGDATGIRLDKLLAILNALDAHLAICDAPNSDSAAAATPAVTDSDKHHAKMTPGPPDEPTALSSHPGDTPRPEPPHGVPYQQLFNDFVRKGQSEETR